MMMVQNSLISREHIQNLRSSSVFLSTFPSRALVFFFPIERIFFLQLSFWLCKNNSD